MIENYTQTIIEQELISLNQNETQPWIITDGKLHKEFVFSDFIAAFGFMTQVAIYAERSNHHPEWSNIYNRVIINLITHESQGITKKDFSLAQQISKVSI